MSSLNNSNENLETKRRQNLEDNRRFLAALKINDICDEIKQMNDHTECATGGRRALKKSMSSDMIRRSSRIRQNTVHNENMPLPERRLKKKKTDENQTHSIPKVKLQLPEHMLVRYHSTSKKVALHNTKATIGDKYKKMSSEKEENPSSEEKNDSSDKTEETNEGSNDQKDSGENNEESDDGQKNPEEGNDEGNDDESGKSASAGGHVSTGPERFVEVGGSGGSTVQKGHGVEAMVHH